MDSRVAALVYVAALPPDETEASRGDLNRVASS
jgi:hypothetical protein